MKIKLDENLGRSLVDLLTKLGHEVDTVEDEGLTSEPDDVIIAAARADGRLLITLDVEIGDARRHTANMHPGVVVVRMHEQSRAAISAAVLAAFLENDPASWRDHIVTITGERLRVRRMKT